MVEADVYRGEMTQSVFHTRYEIEVNLSEDDLGHPDRPGLWDEIYRRCKRGLLLCMECRERDPGCPQDMYVKIVNGRRIACHQNTGVRHFVLNESPRHKALRDRIAVAAQSAGYEAVFEDTAADGSRRTDVLIRGSDGLLLGCEVQCSHITPDAVLRRSNAAARDGIVPLWTVDDVKATPIDRAPWTRLDRLPWEIIASGTALNVRGGVRTLRMERCDKRRATPCPTRRRGRCGAWHGHWDPALGIYLDDMIGRTASREYVPLYMPKKARGGWWMWVTDSDKQEFLQGQPEPLPGAAGEPPGAEAVNGSQEPRPLDPTCHYGEVSGMRAEPARARDTGEAIDAGAWVSWATENRPEAVQYVNGFAVPGDLIALRRRFERAQQLCEELSARLPRGGETGLGETDTELVTWLGQAREDRIQAVLAIHAHPWWERAGNRYEADRALRQAAQARSVRRTE